MTTKATVNLGTASLLNRLRPLQAGPATVAGTFGPTPVTPATSLSINIGSIPQSVSTVALSANWCASSNTDVQCSSTFAGVNGSVNVLQVSLAADAT